ncbi:hypothetical protein NC653_026601 [Populus alba x Populus x berolinensis]|uniref:Uncharacterized protein n=1 Tax=Populus alba x Populus x berolinensis TaxID=444605 RepID=A0AAD6MEJ5_9ROSI|nr:hypothetical protein NC653_026601 [Populus alba x Populus x berolinensis]
MTDVQRVPKTVQDRVPVMSVVSLVAIAGLCVSEHSLGKHLQYSKFWNLKSANNLQESGIQLSSRTGNACTLCCQAFLSGVCFFCALSQIMISATLTITYFLQRGVIEVLCVHKYSTSGVVLDSAILISSSLLLSYFNHDIWSVSSHKGFPEPQLDFKYPDSLLFLLGTYVQLLPPPSSCLS